ncbi:MAG: Gfo/Idh/MocA family oxidoreductase [Planctomycetes bacterium]|nr:Gfo/Idh/MocA family oxidoreductase [Planctomycetota bacterium]
MIGWGIIGCGMIAKFHARAIAEMRGSKLVACYGRDLEKAAAFADEFGGLPYDDLKAMLQDPYIDVVTICTPSGAHLEPGMMAARAGKHVLVEKPLEVTTKRCDQLIAECEKQGIYLGTIFPSRFHRSAILMKAAIEQNRFGLISVADAIVKWFRTQQYYDSGKWRGTWQLDGGGALMNQAIHSVDLLLWLMGPVRSVNAMTALRAHERIEVEDTAVATLEFESGALGTIVATTAAYPGTLKRIEIAGSHGMAVLEEEAIVKWNFAQPKKQDEKVLAEMKFNTTGGGASDPAAIGHVAHRELFKDFVKSIQGGLPSRIDGIEGRRSVELINAVYKSAKTGKQVSLRH